MGGTAVGKKAWIERACKDTTFYEIPAGSKPYWMQDGGTCVEILQFKAEQSPLLVRWQWDREDVIRYLAANPAIQQFLILVQVSPDVQRDRVIQRERSQRWTDAQLWDERLAVERLARDLNSELGLNLRVVSGE